MEINPWLTFQPDKEQGSAILYRMNKGNTAAPMGQNMEMNLNDLTAELLSGPQVLANAGKSVRGNGKAKVELGGAVVRELTLDDLEEIGTAEVGVTQQPALKTLRDSHHRLARLLASGHKDVDAALVTGYSPSRISILKQDPAFKDLMEHYRQTVTDAFSDTITRMKLVTDDALGLIHERIVEEPDSLSTAALTEIVTKIGDRAGFSPVSKSVNLNQPIDPSAIAAMKAKVKERQNGQVKQISQEALDGEYQVVSSGQEPADCISVGVPEAVREAAETEGLPSQGNNIREIGGAKTQG